MENRINERAGVSKERNYRPMELPMLCMSVHLANENRINERAGVSKERNYRQVASRYYSLYN